MNANPEDATSKKIYVLTRTNPPERARDRETLRKLSNEAQTAYKILKEYGIETGHFITASLDEARYGPFPDQFSDNPKFFDVSPELKEKLKKAGFYFEGPFNDFMSATHFWSTGEKEEAR